MDIYDYIVRDHRDVAGLMDDILSIRLPAVRASLFEQVRAELSLHDSAEEQTFYAAIVAADREMAGRMRHSKLEHREVDDLLETLHDTPISSEFWLEKFGELKHAITHHVAEEEGEIFARGRQVITPAQAVQLAQDMEDVKSRMREDAELNIPVE